MEEQQVVSQIIGGRYQLLEQVGHGGAAEVFRAVDVRLNRVVALKLLREDYARDAALSTRFENEARSAARLHHPNIVDVYDYDRADGRPYIAMEYIPGPNLKDWVLQRALDEGPLSEEECRDLIAQVLRGLVAAHAAGIVHRDVKPQNVLVAPDGRLKITDFGIAKAVGQLGVTTAGSAVGTPHYLSPEQARGDEATPRSDLYSVGVMLYELLSGRLPFDDRNSLKVAYAHIFDDVPPIREVAPDVSPELAAVVERAMSKDVQGRYRDAGEMLHALERAHLSPIPASAAPAAAAPAQGMNAADDPTVETPAVRPRFFTPRPFRLVPIVKAPKAQDETREDRVAPPARPDRAREGRLGALWPILAGTLALLVGGLLLRSLLSDGPDRRSNAANAFGAQGTGTAVGRGELPAASGAPSSVVAGAAARTPEVGTEPSPASTPPAPETLAESTLAPAEFPPPTTDGATAPVAEPTASAPNASPTDVPTPTDVQTPAPTPPPGKAPGGAGGIALQSIPLEDGRFKGGYVPKGRRYKGRTVQVLFGQRSRYNTIRATFRIKGTPSGDRNENASVHLVGLDSADGFKTLLRIVVNGETAIQRPSPLREDSRGGKPAQWDAKLLAIDASLLHRGRNVLEISNLEETGEDLAPPWLMLDYAEVRFYEK